ncbi:hypothetical protein CJ671_09010 [Aliarcobacter cryaerophilus]|uniref:Type II secretion system protein n=1 Tax=Aliarcobacter cryaerophilus TaxID=28198 RepID=A0A2S9SNU7_9BACT|nr:hypothetical protein [Aliarcobacter cryaerophilus]PRM88267.1 hypothetical protein CJ671_09010 [Aliarcobacter cryaerophilus]
MKKTFLILELVFVIVILGILYTVFTPKLPNYKLDEVINRVLIYLNYVRYKALVDDKFEMFEPEANNWYKGRWTLKFMRCREDEGGGIYFNIYSENNDKGHSGQNESLKDPLTNKYIFTSNYCKKNPENSPFVLLKNYNIEDVQISCNTTTSLGQISFGVDGKIYTQLTTENLELKKPCTIRFISKTKEFKDIIIYPKTGYIEKIN